MMTRLKHHWVLSLFIGLFLLFQASTTVHALEYGDGPHEHDGKVCVIGLVGVEDQAIIENLIVEIPTFEPDTAIYNTEFISVPYMTPPGRAPPPRSPPHAFQ